MPKHCLSLSFFCLLPLLAEAQEYIPDPGFNHSGTQIISTALTSDAIIASDIDKYGRIITLGYSVAQRYLPTGMSDASFGDNGTTDLVNLQYVLYDNIPHPWFSLKDVKTQSDGKIIICGVFQPFPNQINEDLFIARLNQSGEIDTTFGYDGSSSVSFSQSDKAVSLHILPDDRILLLGNSILPQGKSAILFQFTKEGLLDSEFGLFGKQKIVFDDNTYATDFDVNSLGEIFISAYSYSLHGDIHMKVIKVLSDGTPDSLFGMNGVLMDSVNVFTTGLALSSENDLGFLVAGTTLNATLTGYDIFIKKYDRHGNTQTDFSDNGLFVYDTDYSTEIPTSLHIKKTGELFMSIGNTSFYTDFKAVCLDKEGIPDVSFGTDGEIAIDFSDGGDNCYDLVIQPDGKLVLSGTANYGGNYDFALCRIMPDGTIDESFGKNGQTHINMGELPDFCKSMVLTPDGSVFLAGDTYESCNILKLNDSGLPDSSFNKDAISRYYLINSGVKDLLVDRRDKILCMGYRQSEYYGSEEWDMYNGHIQILRLTPDGIPDPAFGDNGLVKYMSGYVGLANEYPAEFAAQKFNKIIVAGYNETYDYIGSGTMDNVQTRFLIFRLNENGVRDSTFGNHGEIISQLPLHEQNFANAIAVQNDNKIIVAGHSIDEDEPYGFPLKLPVVMRFTEDGLPDSSFAGDGIFSNNIYDYGGSINSIAIQKDQSILLSGYYGLSESNKIMVIRLTPNGDPDTSFNNDGFALIETEFPAAVYDMSIDENNNIILCGAAMNDHPLDFLIMKLMPSGQVDTSLGLGGYMCTSLSQYDDIGYDVEVNGKDIFVAGTSSVGMDANFAVVKYVLDKNDTLLLTGEQFIAFPNPVTENMLTLQYEIVEDEMLSMQLFNASGQLVQDIFENRRVEAGVHRETIRMENNLTRGNYFIVVSGSINRTTLQIVKI